MWVGYNFFQTIKNVLFGWPSSPTSDEILYGCLDIENDKDYLNWNESLYELLNTSFAKNINIKAIIRLIMS